MNNVNKPVLSIAIPTYNRADLLRECLNTIVSQIKEEYLVELIISNNASTDNTKSVVEEFSCILKIKYFENTRNLGFDLNFARCFAESNGKYLWVFSDDDVLLPGRLDKIIKMLNSNNYGLVKLSPVPYYNNFKEIEHYKNIEEWKCRVFSDPIEYMHIMNIYITFITGTIINKSLFESNFNHQRFVGTNIIQVDWNIRAIFSGYDNVVVDTVVVACKQNNSGGYKFISTFSEKFNFILKELVKEGYDKRIIDIINDKLINAHFSLFLPSILYSKNNYHKENGFYTLIKVFWKYKSFWKTIFPIYLDYWKKFLLLKIF